MTKPKRSTSLHSYSPKYLRKLLALGETLPPGSVAIVEVQHDAWCNRLKAPPGECNCSPDLGPIAGAS